MRAHAALRECGYHHTSDGVEDTSVLAHHIDRRQCVKVDWAVPARAVLDERRDEMARAVVEGDVVWVRGDARTIEGYEDIDCGGRRIGGLRGKGIGEMGCKCGG